MLIGAEMRRRYSWLLPFVVWSPTLALAQDSSPALQVRLVRPDQQAQRVLDLFQGTRAPQPAAALAAWKRADGGKHPLSKSLEALIASLNPAMVREWRTLDGTDLSLGFDPQDGHLRWHAIVPGDDGTFAALATALALTDGGSDKPIGDVPVDRLGPPGAPLSARSGSSIVLASSRDDLSLALKRPVPTRRWPSVDSGILFRLDSKGLGTDGPVSRRRLTEALRAIGCQTIEGVVGLKEETLSIELSSRFDPPIRTNAAIDPNWVDWIPASSTLAAVTFVLDPRPEAWDTFFALADRVDRADPARAGLAPLRTRLNLLAAAAKVRPEVDFWPRLQGLSGGLMADPAGKVSGGFFILHAADGNSAERIAQEVLPRLAIAQIRGLTPEVGLDGVMTLGQVSGKPLAIAQRESSVLIGWGQPALACLDAHDHPKRSAGARIRADWGDKPPQRAGIFWPARLPEIALPDASPVVWIGRNEGATARDLIRWAGLHKLVGAFLDRLPLDPPPDR